MKGKFQLRKLHFFDTIFNAIRKIKQNFIEEERGENKMGSNTKVIAVYNQKGGIGKTTTTINLMEALGQRGYKVLGIDNDCQNSLSFLANIDTYKKGMLEAEKGEMDIGALLGLYQWYGTVCDYSDLTKAIRKPTYTKKVRVPGTINWEEKMVNFCFDIIPGVGKDLSLVEMLYVAPTDEPYILKPENRRNARYILKLVIDQIKANFDYDYIFIDCPPSLGILSINALVASDFLIIPTNPDMLSTIGIQTMIENLRELNLYIPDFKILGILFNEYGGLKFDDDLIRDVTEYGKLEDINVFKTKLPRRNRMKQLSAEGNIAYLSTTAEYKSYNKAIDELVDEILQEEKTFNELYKNKNSDNKSS